MRHTEADRKAFNRHVRDEAHKRAVAEWLSENPEVGVLNNGTFYRIVDGVAVSVPFGNVKDRY
jgi:hypothetical protein